jgi:hypothetical protein
MRELRQVRRSRNGVHLNAVGVQVQNDFCAINDSTSHPESIRIVYARPEALWRV